MIDLPDKIIWRYSYIKSDSEWEPAARMSRVRAFHQVTYAVPSKDTAKHRKIRALLEDSGVWLDKVTAWQLGPMRFLMNEQYPAPDWPELGMAGTVHIVVPQRFSIYRPDTHMILHTLSEYRPQMVKINCRLISAAKQSR